MSASGSRPVAIVGDGMAAHVSALALAAAGCEVVLVGRPAGLPDGRHETRTVALFPSSVQLLRNLGVWQHVAGEAAPLAAIRLVDATGWVLRAPEVVFRAADLGEPALAWNVANASLAAALERRLAAVPAVLRLPVPGPVRSRPAAGGLELALSDGTRLACRLAVAAEGRKSPLRDDAGIATRAWSYEQVAIATSFAHWAPHGDVSTELHRDAGPLTQIPLPGRRSALVWVERPALARHLLELDDRAFVAELEAALGGLLGPLGEPGRREGFPLSGLTVASFARNRIALVGESAHVVPPIGAQGLNLGLRDAAVLADCLTGRAGPLEDPGEPAVLAAYDRARRADVAGRTFAVDLLNRSLLEGLLPLQLGRGLGLHALRGLAPLRRAVMRQGLLPPGPLPRLMRGDPDTAPADRTAALA